MASVEINKNAPDFSLPDYKGNMFSLKDFIDKSNVLIVLNRGFI